MIGEQRADLAHQGHVDVGGWPGEADGDAGHPGARHDLASSTENPAGSDGTSPLAMPRANDAANPVGMPVEVLADRLAAVLVRVRRAFQVFRSYCGYIACRPKRRQAGGPELWHRTHGRGHAAPRRKGDPDGTLRSASGDRHRRRRASASRSPRSSSPPARSSTLATSTRRGGRTHPWTLDVTDERAVGALVAAVIGAAQGDRRHVQQRRHRLDHRCARLHARRVGVGLRGERAASSSARGRCSRTCSPPGPERSSTPPRSPA